MSAHLLMSIMHLVDVTEKLVYKAHLNYLAESTEDAMLTPTKRLQSISETLMHEIFSFSHDLTSLFGLIYFALSSFGFSEWNGGSLFKWNTIKIPFTIF